jgi:hypothetical protein
MGFFSGLFGGGGGGGAVTQAVSVGKRSPQIVFLVRDQAFEIAVSGLLPLTYHYLFFEGNLASNTQYKPLGGKLGDPLISDRNGQLNYTFYYSSNVPEYTTELTEYYSFINLIAGKKEIVVANINTTTLPTNYESLAFSYAKSFINIEAYRPTQEEFETGFGEK